MGEWDAAEGLLDRYWELNGDDESLVFERLLLRAMRGEIEATGLPLAARIEQGGPDARWAREALIFGMINRFWWGQAAWALEQWLAQSPDDTIALLLRGRLQDQRGQTSEAILSFRRVLELDPGHDEARFRLTTLLLQIRQGEEALAHLQYLRGRDDGYRADPVPWAKALALQGRTAEARTVLDEYLQGQPDNSEALAERGRIAVAEGDDRLAEVLLRRVRSVDPGNIPARAQLADVLGRNGNATEAAQEAQAVQKLKDDDERIQHLINGRLQTSPNDPGVYHEIAMITLRAGMVREALRWFKRALDVDPNHLPTHQVLVVYYQETGNPILAAKHRALAQKLSVQKK
jgi:predicted Zn-dependent protease